jgi:fibronectin type 3 domain-containing protein
VQKNSLTFKFIVFAFILSLISCSGGDNPPASNNNGNGVKDKPLVPPTVVNTQSDTSKIIIDWPLDSSVNYYQLYWSTNSGSGTAGVLVTLSAGIHSFTHEFMEDGTTPIAKGTNYYYAILAVRDTKESILSDEVTTSLKNNPPPVQPQNPVVTNQQTSITITWDNDAAITNYNVYWSTTSGTGISGTKIQIATGQNIFKHEFIDAGTTPLAKATDYFYVVTAQNTNGESITSVEVKGRLVEAPVVVLPQPPATITITPQNSQIQLAWPLDATVTHYNVYWSTTSGIGMAGSNKVVLEANINNFAHEFLADGTTRLSNGIDFYYVVTALDGTKESSASKELTARLKNKPWIMPLLSEIMGL